MQDRLVGSDGSVIHATRLPAPLLFVIGALSMYLGAAAAVWLFGVLDPAAVAWLRQVGAAVVLLAWRRPGRAAWRGKVFWLAALFGLVTAVMNLVFYEALDRLPLGTAVALEFVGPVLVAAWGSRSVRDSGALLLVVSGVALIADVRWVGSPLGVVFALSAAVLWAGYIVLGKRMASAGLGVDGLAVGFGVATVALSPLALGTGPVWSSPRLLVVGLGFGMLATVVPYVLDQIVLRRMGQARFALLLALLPVTATAVGLVVLRQVPTLPEALGILAVVGGLTIRTRDVEPGPAPL
jgi:inner membrane transporter RhtA